MVPSLSLRLATPRALRRAWTAISGALLASAALAQGAVDLTPLFRPPSPLELQNVRLDWAARPHTVEGFQRETGFVDPTTGAQYEIVSHLVDGLRHYGALRYPLGYTPGGKYPVLVVCHGGTSGVGVEEAANLLVHFPGQCVGDQYFMVIPSYRGEPLGSATAGIALTSDGTRSFADRDVDDTRALLSALLDMEPDMDRARIASWGISRGASVALLLAVRDDRVRRVVNMFGFTDLSLPTLVGWVDAIVNHGAPVTGLGGLVYEDIVAPYLAGQVSLAAARNNWLRRSVAYFVSSLPPLQAHHGMLDNQVDVTHTQALLDALASFGADPSRAQGFYYPTGQHGLNSMPGHGLQVEPFLCALNTGPRGYCGPMTPHGSGFFAGIDYAGQPELQSGNFRLRAHRTRPNGAGIFFVSPQQAYFPSGAGFLCLGAGSQRLGLALVDSTGFAQLDFGSTILAPGAQALLQPGASLYFQFVFRDLGNPNGAWNFTNGLAVTFAP